MNKLQPIYLGVTKMAFMSSLITLFFSCKSDKAVKEIDYTNFSTKEIVLTSYTRNLDKTNTIGNLSLKIPVRLDTFYQWHKTSDCTSCGRLQYRFSDRRYKQFAEGGFFWTYVPDSVYQITISYVPIREIPDSITQTQFSLKDTGRFEHLVYQLTDRGEAGYQKKEFKEINNRGYLIAAFITSHGFITNDTTLYLTASTQLKDRTLNIVAECGVRDTVGFIESMYKTILSIRIAEK